MAVDHVKSLPITTMDTAPQIFNTSGEGGPGYLMSVSSGDVVGIAASSIDATYQFVRVPSNCKVKQVLVTSEAQAAGTMDIGLYYATDGEGNRPTALLVAAAISRTLFAAGYSVAAASAQLDVIGISASFTPLKRNQPLWQAAGLASDPGGFFDIVGSLAVAITTGTGKMGMTVNYAI